MRAAILCVLLVAAPARADELSDWYGKRANWRSVRAEVLDWHGTTKNGCVAFASTALRRLGVDVPMDASRLTLPFSEWLEAHGWVRIDDPEALAAGDLVFTERAEYPWHVYVFHSWKSRRRLIARVLDNQGFLRARPVLGDPDRAIEAFAYALRAPAP